MKVILFDQKDHFLDLLPLTFLKPISELRVGAFTIKEKWEQRLSTTCFTISEQYLNTLSVSELQDSTYLYINGGACPNDNLISTINHLSIGEGLYLNDYLIAVKSSQLITQTAYINDLVTRKNDVNTDFSFIAHPWDIFKNNKTEIINDTELIKDAYSHSITDPHTITYGKDNIFIDKGVDIKASIINAEDGPIILQKNSQIHEGSIIKGAFVLGESAHVNMGAKIKGDTTIGKFCKVGGEVSNSVFQAYSNKGHDGFIGNSVIGEWCNLGADTNASNLKNNYSNVRIWNYRLERYIQTEMQFCGLIMGDHSKCGINTMFNTATVVGLGANIFGGDFPTKHIPSFSWGGPKSGFQPFLLEKFYEVASLMMERRGISIDSFLKQKIIHCHKSFALSTSK